MGIRCGCIGRGCWEAKTAPSLKTVCKQGDHLAKNQVRCSRILLLVTIPIGLADQYIIKAVTAHITHPTQGQTQAITGNPIDDAKAIVITPQATQG